MKKMIRIIIAMAVVLATAASLLSACVPEGDRYKKENLVKCIMKKLFMIVKKDYVR